MRRFAQITVLSLIVLIASFGNAANAMQGGGCGCGGSGVACQTNQRVVLSGLALVACFYQINFVNPLAEGKSTGAKWLIYGLSYGIPAALGYGAYGWWNAEASAKKKNQPTHLEN